VLFVDVEFCLAHPLLDVVRRFRVSSFQQMLSAMAMAPPGGFDLPAEQLVCACPKDDLLNHLFRFLSFVVQVVEVARTKVETPLEVMP